MTYLEVWGFKATVLAAGAVFFLTHVPCVVYLLWWIMTSLNGSVLRVGLPCWWALSFRLRNRDSVQEGVSHDLGTAPTSTFTQDLKILYRRPNCHNICARNFDI